MNFNIEHLKKIIPKFNFFNNLIIDSSPKKYPPHYLLYFLYL